MNADLIIRNCLKNFEKTQYTHVPNFDLIKDFPIITRDDLRNTPMKKGLFETKTSGSTGEPVTVQKTHHDAIWYAATNIREFIWRGWDWTKNYALFKPLPSARSEKNDWGIPRCIAPVQGKQFFYHYDTLERIQEWLELKNPHYIHCAPSIVAQLDLSRISNLIDVKGTGELGGSMYSSEECGTIAIQCPDNKNNFHVMENQLVEVNDRNEIIISTLTNEYIRRYKHGDVVLLGECSCGRKLQTITKINGRIRNMFVMPDGSKKWPTFGSRTYHEKYGIKRYKLIQKSISDLVLQIICNKLSLEQEEALRTEMQEMLQTKINITIEYVNEFKDYKFEEFVSLV